MAVNDAISKGAEEAILLDKNGFISEGSGENLFIVKNNSIIKTSKRAGSIIKILLGYYRGFLNGSNGEWEKFRSARKYVLIGF